MTTLLVAVTAVMLTLDVIVRILHHLQSRTSTTSPPSDREQVVELLEVLHARTQTLREERAEDRRLFAAAIERLSAPMPGHELPGQTLAFMQETQRFLIQALQANVVQANSRLAALAGPEAQARVAAQEHAARTLAYEQGLPMPQRRADSLDTFTEEAPDSSPVDTIRDAPPIAMRRRDRAPGPADLGPEESSFLAGHGIDFSDLEPPPVGH